jgi:hypothetical protein
MEQKQNEPYMDFPIRTVDRMNQIRTNHRTGYAILNRSGRSIINWRYFIRGRVHRELQPTLS